MSSFNTVNEWATLSEEQLSASTRLISLADARASETFADPVVLYDLWLGLPGDIPHQNTVKPNILGPGLLPNMYILDVVEGDDAQAVDFRWRLFGSSHSLRYGQEATGTLLSRAAQLDTSAAGSYEVAKSIYESKSYAFFLTEFSDETMLVKTSSTVALPLLGDNGRISRIFGCSVWHTAKRP